MASILPGPIAAQSIIDYARKNDLPPSQITEKRWVQPATIDGLKWDALFPYQLIVVDRSADGTYVPKREAGWTFTLPFPPESMNISMPFAIKTSITQGGSMEEHGGAPIRMISL